jgi:EmrB/QacA subfamily drug resistance transporter
MGASVGNIGEHPHEVHHHHIPAARHDDPDVVVSERWILVVAIIGSSMAFIDGTVANVALPSIQSDLGATLAEAQWVVEAYALLLASLILVGGSLGDRFGHRLVFVLGVSIFTLGSVGCAFAASIDQLVVARAVQAIGAAGLIPGSLAILGAAFEGERRGAAIGTWSSFAAISAVLGQVLGGFLIDTISWRVAFIINVPLAIVVLLIVFRYVPESRAEHPRALDLPGVLLVTVGLGGVVYGLIGASDQSLDALEVIAIVVGMMALVGFVVVERHSPQPLVPLHLFGSRNFSGANLMTFLLYAGFGGALFLLPIVLIQVHGYSATAATGALVPFAVITFVMGRWAGGLVTRYGEKLPLMVGPALAAAGFILFAVPGVGGSYWTTYFPAVVVLGFGMSLVFGPLSIAILNAVEREHSGLGSGVNRSVQRTAKLLGLAALAFLVLAAFDNNLDARVDALDLSPGQKVALRAEEVNLGANDIFEDGSGEDSVAIDRAVDQAFISAFRFAMFISAGMAVTSAVAAALLIQGKKSNEPGKSGPHAGDYGGSRKG